MDTYLVSLLLGAVGFGTMAVTGLARHGHGGRAARTHSRGGASGRASAARGSHARGHRAAGGRGTGRHTAGRITLSLTSPRFLFSAAMGLGLTGLVLRAVLPGVLLPLAAIAGGLLFERVLVRPFWDSLMRFASEPALTLESCVTECATAVTSFDGNGHGIVSVELDGQIVQLLATLQATDRGIGRRVRAGSRVRIEDVDAAQNRCVVSLL